MYKGIAFDFDETLVNSIESLVSILNEDYNLNVDAKDVKRWDFKDVYPTLNTQQINAPWEDERFFQRLTFKDNTIEILENLSKEYPIKIYTMRKCEKFRIEKTIFEKQYINK